MALITLQEGTTGNTAVFSSTITAVDKKGTDVLSVDVSPLLTVNLNDEVKYYDLNNNYIFGGIVKNITTGNGTKNLEVYDYSNELLERIVNNVYRNMTAESIIQDIISNYTTLTYISSVTTIPVISKIVFKDEKIVDALNQLIALFDGEFYVDKNKNFYLELNSEKTSSKSIVNGTDTLISEWKYNTDKQATQVIVKGAATKTRTQESFTGTGTVFTLSRSPTDLKVWEAANPNVFFVQTVDGQIAGDYTVDTQNNTVTFNTAKTNPVFEYSYDSQIKVTAGSGTIVKELVKTYIETMQEARNLARTYLSTYQNGILTATFRTPSTDWEAYRPNQKIFVTDTISNPNVSQEFQITKTVRKYPGFVEVTVGEVESNIFDWQKETQARVKQLESLNDNTDFIQIYEYISDGVKVQLTLNITRAQYRTIVNNALFWDSRNWDTNIWDGQDNIMPWTDF